MLNFTFEKSTLHAIALGYFFTILVGFGTRVTLEHSVQAPRTDALAVGIFCFTQVVVVARILAGLGLNFGFDYGDWIVANAGLLLVTLAV